LVIIDNRTRKSLLLGYIELDDGWIFPFNGYQYKAILIRNSYDVSQTICQNLGGDLIVYGFRDDAVRV